MYKLVLSGLLLVLGALAGPLWGQNFPARQLHFILPFPPGGPTDILGRMLAKKLSEQMGQPVLAENRPGAGGNLGLELAARAAPDGYTMALTAPSIVTAPSLYRKLNYKQSDRAGGHAREPDQPAERGDSEGGEFGRRKKGAEGTEH